MACLAFIPFLILTCRAVLDVTMHPSSTVCLFCFLGDPFAGLCDLSVSEERGRERGRELLIATRLDVLHSGGVWAKTTALLGSERRSVHPCVLHHVYVYVYSFFFSFFFLLARKYKERGNR